ncbi:uncharacterized protein [Panulirus ornatus]|uniref:uncharacterized protein isoform X5 n=1 Tax=Panulirus ornatus TaxID=150431 RepID=UPI003A8B927C
MSDDHPSVVPSALAGDTAGVEAALQRGAPVDEVDEGRTALQHAAAEGLCEIVQLLLYWKADYNKKSTSGDDNGGTAVHLAAEAGHTEVLRQLFTAGAHGEALDHKGRRASHRAAARGQQGSLEVLKSYGCNLEARDHGKATPLHHAAFSGDQGLVRWFVQAGVNTMCKDKNGRLPKDVAKRYGHHSVHRYLKDSGSKKNSMFGMPKVRRSMRENSSHQRRVHESAPPQIEATQISQAMSSPSTDSPDVDPPQVELPSIEAAAPLVSSTVKPSQEDARVSDGSLSPPDSPTRRVVELRAVEPRRRTWSLRSSRGRTSLKSQVEDLTELKMRQEEELDFKEEEIAKLQNQLSRVEHEKGQMEEQLRELGHHLDCQQQQLADSVDSQQQIQVLSVQNEEYQNQLAEKLNREVELLEQDAFHKETIEKLTKEIEHLSLELKTNEEKLLQSQEASSETDDDEEENSAASKIASLMNEVEHLTYMLNETGQTAISSQEKLEKKIATLKEEDEINKNTIAVLSEKLREAEEKGVSSPDQDERLKELQEQDEVNKHTIATLNAKLQHMMQNLNDQDNKMLTLHKQQHARIEELTEQAEKDQKTISTLMKNADQLSQKLKENQETVSWYQLKEKEHEEREKVSHQTIISLKGEMDNVIQRQETDQQKMPYERGATVVALQKREAAQKQTIKALENRLNHLTQKMADAEQASLTVQKEQLETINSLQQRVEQLMQQNSGSGGLEQDDQAKLQEFMEEDYRNKLVIDALNKKVDQLSGELKKNYSNFFSWQAQQKENDKEHEEREAASQQTIAALKQEISHLSQRLATYQSTNS